MFAVGESELKKMGLSYSIATSFSSWVSLGGAYYILIHELKLVAIEKKQKKSDKSDKTCISNWKYNNLQCRTF